MKRRGDELEAFKTEIDLVAYAESYGFDVDRKRTSRTSVAMKHGVTGERILVAKKSDGHFIYASVHDHTDSGTIIDFEQRRKGGTLGDVRKALRPFIGESAMPVPRPRGEKSAKAAPEVLLEAAAQDFDAVRQAFDEMRPIEHGNRYLEERCIPAIVYMHPRMKNRIRVDRRTNVVFPHWEPGGALTGYEIKNRGFTGFATGGAKRLWGSGIGADDTELVICETAIDALSFATLFGVEGRRFVSTAGALNPAQLDLVRSAMRKLPSGGRVVLATDADEGGDLLAETITAAAEGMGCDAVEIVHRSPAARGADWNDVLSDGFGI